MSFVSLLSVSEFVMVADAGFQPLGTAIGTVVYYATELEPSSGSHELKGPSQRSSKRIGLILSRVQQQAKTLGASGVIAIRINWRDLGEQLWECTAIGTAIGTEKYDKRKLPFLCTLSGQEYAAIIKHGYRPVGVSIGTCHYYQQVHQRVEQKLQQNVERSDVVHGLSIARSNALRRLEESAALLDAEGVLAVHVEMKRTEHRSSKSLEGYLVEVTALGTAVVSDKECAPCINHAVLLTD